MSDKRELKIISHWMGPLLWRELQRGQERTEHTPHQIVIIECDESGRVGGLKPWMLQWMKHRNIGSISKRSVWGRTIRERTSRADELVADAIAEILKGSASV